jgi:hypothetical protein
MHSLTNINMSYLVSRRTKLHLMIPYVCGILDEYIYIYILNMLIEQTIIDEIERQDNLCPKC